MKKEKSQTSLQMSKGVAGEKNTLHDKHFHSIKRNETPCEVGGSKNRVCLVVCLL